MKKVIAYSLYGDGPQYIEGLKHNVNLLDEIFPDPEWGMKIYYDDSVPADKLVSHPRVEYSKVENDSNYMLWRFYAWDDPDVEVYLCRDIDDRLNMWDYNMIQEWEKTPHSFIVGRVHHAHNIEILGGLWGGRPKDFNFNMKELVDEFQNKNEAIHGGGREAMTARGSNAITLDQIFLAQCIWPLVKDKTLSFGFPFSYESAEHINIPMDPQLLTKPTPMGNSVPVKRGDEEGFMITEHVRTHMCGCYIAEHARYEDHWDPSFGYQSPKNDADYKSLKDSPQIIQEINNPEEFHYFGHNPNNLRGNKYLLFK